MPFQSRSIRPVLALLIFVLFTRISWSAPRTIASPATQPYAVERKFASSDFVRFDWKDSARSDRIVPVKIYFPTEGAGPFPVIIYSHGLGGTRELYEYLSRQWTANGYVVIHPQHAGSDDHVWRDAGKNRLAAMVKAANLENSIARARDVQFVIDQLESLNANDEHLKGKLDLKRIGVSGHSFGAQTTMLIAGQVLGAGTAIDQLKLSDDRVIAGIAMSEPAPVGRVKLDEQFAGVHIPVFMMTGTKDVSPIGETTAADRRIPFDHLAHGPDFLLTLTGGDHMVFSGRAAPRPNDLEFQKMIRISSTAFWDAYLKQDAAAKTWLADGGFKTLLADDGTFEQK